ncbi:hemagglutinin/hemolysin-like protein [Leptolyngbya boryana NIES-2135]|jgi:hypothetical protein|uniref:Hemagglutinin/hemolysin-like protein n=1 Tax=Leptolyngbya boryana NIES-2135 TaxID=1973484 RepID=A0A1Z4JB13_LEPBY|nr:MULTISPECIES: Ig-like domain-containing protein [Leptolyngbya]BAY53969.1 hemagglutinin/hemolysin-like protein [Leptolyngbya boryana NIES-2135]MBD2371228.1 cadherin-like domain-containing protein [Leptolyngbya sp. FACHB-161]MBD2377665.1 cadherin-like domain-containing protein [Leptolyngbya sp. FACHB-238]MBD2402117.1 cadherin-like domain-containing protein [Leptolyngbya sp. FACHB-239]MBD2408637.1 cadherin-like domain-containing protein [Leptolyngbya sp. FACHB-402]
MSSDFNRASFFAAQSLNQLTTFPIELQTGITHQPLWEITSRSAPSSFPLLTDSFKTRSNIGQSSAYLDFSINRAFNQTASDSFSSTPWSANTIVSGNRDRSNELFFIDSSVEDAASLLSEISPSQIVYLNASQDGVEQISEILAQRQGISAIHIIAHGDAGSLRLGNAELSGTTLDSYRTKLQAWQTSLTDNADILIYGCDVAAGEQGQAFVNQISQLTGADVAASDDLTGNAALGGDWILEFDTGTIDTTIFANIDYQHILATVSLTSGKLVYDADGSYLISNGQSAITFDYQNDLTFSLSGTDLVITENNTSGSYSETISAGTGITQVNSYSVRVALSSITSGLEIKTRSGADKVTFSSGFSSFSNVVSLKLDMGDGEDTVTANTEINTKGGAFTINGGDGSDKINFNSTVYTAGGSFSIDGEGGDDTVTVSSSVYTQGGNLSIDSNTITINAGSTLSSRNTSATDHSTGTSIGNSGTISLTGKQITIGTNGSTSSANLYSQVGTGSTYTAGNITISASETELAATVLDGTETSTATISLYKANLQGKDVKISAEADYAGEFDDTSSVGNSIIGFLDNFSLAGGAAISTAKATITVDVNTSIIAASLDASATATTNAIIQPLFSFILGAAYGKADSTAKVSIAGTVTTTGNVSISTLTDNTVDVQVITSKWSSSNVATNSTAAAAISELYSESTAEITDTAKITAGGNVSVTANTIDRNRTNAKSNNASNGTLSVAAAVSFEDGKTNALIDGNVTAVGNVTVEANQKNEDVESIFSGGSSITSGSGVRASAGISDIKDDVLSGIKSSATSALWDKLKSVVSTKSSSASSRTRGKTSSFQIGAAVAYIEDNNTVLARIGGRFDDDDTTDTTAATVTAQTGSIIVDATAEYRPDVTAISMLDNSSSSSSSTSSSSTTSSSSSSNGSFAGSAAVALGDYVNNVTAYIGNSAVVNAYKGLSVTANTLNNYSAEWGVNLVEPFTGTGAWYSKAGEFVSNLTGYLNSNLGLDEYIFDSWSQAAAKSQSKLAAAGAVTVLSLDQTSKAYIDQSAQINQNTSLRSDQQTVLVEATSVNESVHFGGNIALPGLNWNDQTNSLGFSIGGAGTKASNAIGGAVLVIDYRNDVTARIEDGVTLYADSLKVNADSETMSIDVAAAGGSADTFGFSGVGTWIYVDNTTTAQIDDGVTLVVGDNLVSGSTASLVVNAEDTSNVINIMGGVAVSESIGFGASIGFNTVDRKTRAVIGNLSDSGETDATTSITSSGNVSINAKNDGYIGSFSLASAISTGGSVTTNSDGSTTGSTTFGVGISGDVALNEVADTTEAYLRDVKVTTNSSSTVSVTANNDSEILAIGGSVALTIGNNNQSTASVGLAGSYGQNTVSQTTNAYLENTTLSNSKSLTVNATNTSEVYAVVAGGSGAANSAINVGIAGAVTINEIDNSTKAYIANSTTTISGAITVSATDDSTLHADAGGAALAIAIKPSSNAASVSAGAGLSYNDVTNMVSAYVDKSTLTASGNVAITAASTGTIDSFALGAAAAVSTNASWLAMSLSGAGAGANNDIETTISAYVTNGSSITTSNSGTISISATDDSDITADSGGYSLALSYSSVSTSGSVGVSIAENDIHNTIDAYVDKSTLTSAGAVNITAQSTAEIDALSIGGSASSSSGYLGSLSLSGAGAGTNNNIDNTISAQIKNSATVKTSNNAAVNLTATDNSTITSDAGGVSIAATLGDGSSASLSIGAAVATNQIGQAQGHTIQALVDNATISADGIVTVTAKSTATIDGLAFSGSAAASGSTGGGTISLSGSGTGIENTIKAKIAAGIQNGGKVTTDETATLTAIDDSEIIADAGAASLSIGGSTDASGAASVGVAIADNEISNTVKAYVDKGTVSAGDFNLTANSTATIENFGLAGAISVAVSSGASVSAAGAGTGVTNTLGNTIQSYIQNSSTITTTADSNNGGDLNLNAIDQSTIKSIAVGGSIAISGSSASFSMAIGAVTVENTIDNTVQSFIGQSTTDSTTISAGDDITLKAQSQLTMTENTAVAASLAAGVAPTSASFSGAGASVTTTTTNEVGAFIRNVNTSSTYNIQATGEISLAASDTSNIDPTVGSGSAVASWIGASVGVSTTDTTVNNTVQAYIDNAKVASNNDNLNLAATSNPDIDALSVATSVAASLWGGAGTGAEATATVKSTVEARIGSGSSVKGKTINVTADSTDDVATDAYGASAGMVAIGASVADSITQSTTKAHVTGATLSATNLNITSTGDGKVDAGVISIAGGVLASGSGNSADATFDSTVKAYVGDSTTISLTGNLNITATAQPDADANAFGLSVSGLVQAGYSAATAEVTPQVDAYVGSSSTISASNLTVLAQQSLPTSGDAAHTEATGAGGALFGSVNASESTATNSGQVSAYVGKNSKLTITNTASIKADADSQQTAEADGYNGGILALGANIANAESSLTTQAYLDTGVNITAKDLKIQAIGNDYNYANAVAGGGGVVSGQAALSSTNNASMAKVRIEDGDSTSGNVEINVSNAIEISADQTTKFNSKANSVNASVVGASGAFADNTVNTISKVTIGIDSDNTNQNLVINAASFTVNATQTILKAELSDETAEAGSGGVVDASAVISSTVINNATTITIGDSSTTNAYDTTISTTGEINLRASNDVSAWDETTLDSGGVISIAAAESTVKQQTNQAIVTIQDANLYSNGDITLSAKAKVTLDVTANASSYGLAGEPSAESIASTNTQNQIQLKNGAYLRSEGDVNLLAGQNANGDTNVIDVNARSNVWNYTAAPLSSAGSSDATVTLENTITIDAGAQIQTVYDTNLLTTKGEIEAVGLLKSQDSYEALIGTITGASVADIKRTDNDITATTGVTVNGTIEVSIENQETLTIDESLTLISTTTVDGVSIYPINITQKSDGVGTVTLSVEDLYSNISTYISQLQELKSTYAGDTSTVAAYTAEIAYWENQLEELGSVSQVTYIEIPDIKVKVGDIRVTGDYLKGSGVLNSPGDAKITITNGSPYYLRVNNLKIPEVEGGRILFNSTSVTSNSTINTRNTSENTANFSQVITSDNSDDALIQVENTYDPTFAVQASEFAALGVDTPEAPDLEVIGTVDNAKGTVQLINDEGSVIVYGSLNAETIDIQSGSDFVLTDDGTVFEFNPSSKVSTFQNTITISNHGLSTGDQVFYSNGTGTSIGGLSDNRSYYAIVIDSNTIKLASTEDNAFANKTYTLSSGGSQLTLTGHSLSDGDQVVYRSSNGSISATYYVDKIDNNTIKLASIYAPIFGGGFSGYVTLSSGGSLTLNSSKEIDLTSTGSGTEHSLSLTDDLGFLHVGGNPRSQLSSTATSFENGPETSGSSSVDPSSSSSITASSNVFINARYLNINGVIQSGTPDRTLTLSNSFNATISAFKSSYDSTIAAGKTPSTKYLTLSTDTDGTSIDAKYNAEENRIELDDVEIEGGYMQLVGHIISTGDGNLRVMDGFGRINITNNTNYDIAINSIDAGGSGIEGKLQIIDTAKTGANGEALMTTYTRVGSNVTVTDTSTTSGKTTTLSNTRAASYNPLANQRYTWVTGQSSITETQKTYGKSSFWGSDDLAKDPGTAIETTTMLLDETPLLEGAYIETTTNSNLYAYNREVVTTSSNQLVDQDTWTETSGWWIFKKKTYYRRDTYQQGKKTINTHSYDADSPIAVTFIGYDTGSVSITSTQDILLLNSISNKGGSTTLKSTSGYIDNLSTNGVITSNSLTLSGSKLMDLSTDVSQLQFNATGNVSITDIDGNVTIFGESYSSSGTVTLSTNGSLLSAGAGGYDIKAYTIDLTSETGSIGSSTQSLRVDSGFKTTTTIMGMVTSITATLLSTADGTSGVTLDAADNIYLKETDGDLYLVSATAGGNVNLTVSSGGLVDNNLAETIDPYSQTQLESLWSQIGLTTDRSSKSIASFKQQAEHLYETYWNYRNVKSSVNSTGQTVYTADAYNANFSYSYSDTAKTQLRAQGYSDSEIIAMAAEKTTQYQTLHTLFSGGSVTLTGDDAYMSTVITDLFKDSDFTGKNLTNISIYDPNLIAQKYNVSSSQQSSLSQGSKWSLDQLKNTVAPGLFGSVTDTQYTIEEANITAGGDVAVTASGAIGRTEGSITINNWSSIKNWATDLTEAQRLALSYAERDDITYYDAAGNKILDPKKSTAPISKVVISQKQDVDIDATGEINLTAGGNVFLGSEQDINLDQVKAGSEVRIKAAQGIVNVATTGAVNVVGGGDLVLEAGSSSVGSSTAPITIDLKDNIYYHNGKLYLLSSSATWEAAQTYAQSLGGNLVTINDATEEAWLRTTFGTTESFWIGLTDKVTEGTFAWANGETTTYRNWAPGEPNNWNGNEDYASMNYGNNRQWNDASSTATMRGIIELNVQEYNGHFYLLNPIATWEIAQTAAQAVGGNLVTINDAAEEQWLRNTFSNTESFWIGLTDKVTEGTFAWASGETTPYRNWAPGEPNNWNGNEDYVSMNYGSNRQWNDASSTATMRGIVEISSLGGSLTARAKENIYVANAIGTLNVDQVYAENIVSLSSTGAIVDANQNAEANLQSDFLTLNAISVGTRTNTLDLEMTNDSEVKLNTTQDSYLRTIDDLSVDFSGRTSGAVTITGDNSNNTITLFSSSDSLNSTLNITVDAGGGNDTLLVKPTRSGASWNFSNLTITGGGLGTIAYSNSETVKITPIAGNDSASTTEETSTIFTVLGNDINWDGFSPISISTVNGSSATVGSVVTLNSGAQVTFNANNTFTYNPNGKFDAVGAGKTATDSFTYSVKNAMGGVDTATVSITINGVNDVPIATKDNVETDEATSVTIAALSNDSDIDTGDTFTITHLNGTAITSGTTRVLASGAQVTFNTNGTFSYNPNSRFEYLGIGKTATDNFTYTISDGKGGTSTATVTLTINGINDTPVASANSATTTENSTVTIAALSNDTDIDTGDTLSITKVNGTTLTAGSSVLIGSKAKVTLNANGSLTYNPNGKFEYLGTGKTATDSFTYTISDGKGGTSTATVTLVITGVNDAPTVKADSATTNEDVSTAISVLSNDSDIDTGDTLSITQVNGSVITAGSTMTLTSGAKLTLNANGTFTYNPNGKFVTLGMGETGTDSFTYTVSDGKGGTSTATVSLKISGGTFYERTGSNNSLNGIDVGYSSNVAFADIDKDGDLDAFMGSSDGTIRYYRNTNGSFAQVTGTANPLNSVSGFSDTSISFADIDRDGDLDAFIGDGKMVLKYYQNTNGSFTQITDTSNGIADFIAPSFVDIDNDGDLDAFTGQSDGTIKFYRNTNGSFANVTGTANPFNGVDVGDSSTIAFADIDQDGDSDAFIGESDGTINYYRNTNGSFAQVTGTSNPFNGVDVGQNSTVSFVDINGDGDLDAFIGEFDGNINYFENTNTPPVAVNDSVTMNEDTTTTISALSNDSDANAADTMTITRVNGTTIASGSTVTLTSGAKVTLNTAGTFTYNPNGKFEYLGVGKSATDSFTYTISDGKGGISTATATLTITGVNDGPIAMADSATTNEDTSATLTVLSNDSDVDTGDTLNITQVNGTSITAGSTITLTSGAKVTLNSTGTFTYNPNGKFDYLGTGNSATDSFTYIISDGKGGTSTATVNLTITGVNDGPIALADSSTTNEDTSATLTVLSNDSDVDTGDTLSVTHVNGTSITSGSTITLISGAKVTLNSTGTFTYNPNGKFDYLGTGKSATDSFTYTISDGKGGTSTATATLTITGVNDGPVATADSTTTDEDTAITVTVLSNDSDVDTSDTLSITQVNGTTITAGSTITLTSGAKLTFNSNGTFTYNPNGKFSSLQMGGTGSDSFTYTISDGKGGISTAAVSLSITGLTFRERTGTSNPFNGLDVGDKATPAFADIDKDGDLDAFVGSSDGTIRYYRNTSGTFAQVTGTANPFNGIDWGDNSSISFADIDRDGDLDAFIGGSKGIIGFYRNNNGSFTSDTNPFSGLTFATGAPTFADIDGDGDLDAFITNASSSTSTTGSITFYRNTNGSFAQVTGTANPFNGMSVGVNTRYGFADIDKDGDLDMFIGDGKASIAYYRNANGSFTAQSVTANPFSNITGISENSSITFADIDGDGDSDAIVGQQDGTIKYLENK